MNDTLVIRKRYVVSAMALLVFGFLTAALMLSLLPASDLGVEAILRARAVTQDRLGRIGELLRPVPRLSYTARTS